MIVGVTRNASMENAEGVRAPWYRAVGGDEGEAADGAGKEGRVGYRLLEIRGEVRGTSGATIAKGDSGGGTEKVQEERS